MSEQETFEKIIDAHKFANSLQFNELNRFAEKIHENLQRVDKGVLLLYIWQSIVNDTPLSVTMREYEWAESENEPKVDYNTIGRLMLMKEIDFGEKRIFLRRRNCPAYELDVHTLRSRAANMIQKMIEDL